VVPSGDVPPAAEYLFEPDVHGRYARPTLIAWRWFLSVVLALLWVPLAAHCEIERLIDVELGHHADTDHASDSEDTGCDDCSLCQSAKVGPQFRIKLGDLKPAFVAVLPPWPPSGFQGSVPIESPQITPSPHAGDSVLPHVCLLTSRTSLPVRAPSLAS
jgi:hypothetical protein